MKSNKTKIVGVVGDYDFKEDKNENSFYLVKDQFINCFSTISSEIAFIMIPCDMNQIHLLANIIDGLVLTGGQDINPKYFFQKKHHKCKKDCELRTEFELKILKAIIKQEKPVLGICRGAQLMNIALGGDMMQDINSYISTDIEHDGSKEVQENHKIRILENSLISEILKNHEFSTNSLHHQAIDKLGHNIVATGFSISDNIVEIIELKNYQNFFLGVQWHPEFLNTQEDKLILKAFCESLG